MRILFAISVLAFVALLWASVAIVQHIRRSRRRRRRVMDAAPAPASSSSLGLAQPGPLRAIPEVSNTDFSATDAVTADTSDTKAAPPPLPDVDPEASVEAAYEAADIAHDPLPEPLAEPELEVEPESDFPEPEPETVAVEPEPLEPVPSSSEQEETVTIVEVPAEIPTSVPVAEVHPPIEADFVPTAPNDAPLQDDAAVAEPDFGEEAELVATSAEMLPEPKAVLPPRPVASRGSSPKHPLASLVPPLKRPDWAYFNKDMGDLSDPEPRSRSKIAPNRSDT